VCLASSKSGKGLNKIVERFEKLQKVYVIDKEYNMKPKIFVMGCTNVGKSSFLNKLISFSTKNKAVKQKGLSGKTIYNRESDEHEPGLMKGSKLISELLTVSPIPGTTMDFIEVKSLKYGLKIYDTPGIPNAAQVVSQINDYRDALQTFNNQKIKPVSLSIKSGYSIWIGALWRFDFLNGDRSNFSFFFSPHVTIHKTPTEKAQKIYDDHSGTLIRPTYTAFPEKIEFERHEISLKLDSWEKACYDIAISGLGWVSLSGKGLVQMMLYLPKGIYWSIRDPLMPFEIEEKGLDRYTGNTINKSSKKNIVGRERFSERREIESQDEV
jgi:30S ribosome assembly GTPase